MRMSDRDGDAHLFDGECAKSVLDGDVARVESRRRFVHDRVELSRCHGLVGRIVDSGHRSSLVHLAHGAEEEQNGAIGRASDAAQERWDVDGSMNDGG